MGISHHKVEYISVALNCLRSVAIFIICECDDKTYGSRIQFTIQKRYNGLFVIQIEKNLSNLYQNN